MRAVSSGCDGKPVLARLCCFGSLSDGERERFLLDSDSGIAVFFSARFDQDSDMVWRAKASDNGKVYEREFGSG